MQAVNGTYLEDWDYGTGLHAGSGTYFDVGGKQKTPHKCPVCDGAGLVSKPLYLGGTGTDMYPCKCCEGKGIIWG